LEKGIADFHQHHHQHGFDDARIDAGVHAHRSQIDRERGCHYAVQPASAERDGRTVALANQNFNLDSYVVSKALDGLFYMLAQGKKQSRTDPATQTTALIKDVFGKKL
jgi:hypothetical protein